MELFIKNVTKKNRKIENIPIEWILPHKKKDDNINNTLFNTTIYNILIIFGYIISYINFIYDYLKILFIKKS